MPLLLALSLGLSSTVKADPLETCESLLTECAQVVEQQELTIQAQDEKLEAQEKLLKIEEQEVERLDKVNKTTRGIAWAQLGLILLLLL